LAAIAKATNRRVMMDEILTKIFEKAPNYTLAFLMCFACSIMAMMGKGADIKFLILSDINVAIFLFIAYLLDVNRSR
jgi:hypothetical protein